MLVVVTVYAYRVLRVQVLADAEGIVVRNLLSPRDYEWSEVEDFTLGATAMGAGTRVLLSNGESKSLEASFGRWWLGRGHLDAKNAARCRELLAQLRETGTQVSEGT